MAKVNIMIIEDDAITAMDIENQLKNLGYGVSAIVSYGEEVIQKTKETTPDLVLMDIVLKGEMDGIEAAEKIRSQFDIPVIFLTAYADEEWLKHAKITLPFGYVLKPFRKRELRIVIEMSLYAAKIDSKRKQAEIRLKKSEERYRGIVEDQTELICRFRPDGTLSFVNESYCRYFRKNREELIGKKLMPLIPESDQKKVLENLSSLNPNDPVMTHEHRVVDHKGKICWHSWTNRAIFDDQNNLLECQAVGWDITERKQAEEALRESEDRYKSLFKNNHSVMLLIDPGSADIVDANPAATYFYGWSYEELIRMKITDINTLTERQVFQEMKRAKTEQLWIFYFKHRLANGKICDVEVYSGPIKVYGRELLYSIIHDITERKLAEEALRKSEEKFRGLSDLLPQVVFETDKSGNLTFVNRIAFNLFGYTRDDFIKGVNAFQMLIHEDRDRAKENIERILKGEKEIGTEYTALGKDGKTFPALIHSSPIVSEGESIGLRGTITDLSEVKRTERKLQESEEKLWNIIEHSNEIFYIHDMEHNLTYVSPTSKEILGYTSDEMMRDWTELTTDNPINQKGIKITERAIETGEKQNPYLLEVTRKNNTLVLLEIDESPIKDEGGKVVGITGAARDVTERKKAETALRASEEKYRFLAENMADVVWTLDLDFRTTYVSHSIEKTLGFTPEERKQQTLEEMITPESFQKVQAKFIEELQRDEEGSVDPDRSVIIEVEYYHKEGSTVWMENIVKAIRDPGGAIVGIHGVSRDINERKQAEEALRESEKKHKTLVHNIPGMVYRAYTDWSTEIISGSKEVCGYTNEELKSQEESWLSIIYPDDKEKVFKEDLELTKRQQDAVQTYRIVTKDSNIRWIEDRKTSIFSGAGEFKGIDGIAFDITARKQTEETLKEREVELARKNLRLEELNSALKILLEKRNQDKTELEENVLTNMKELVLPYVAKLKKADLSDKQEVFADILQSNLEDIVSPFARKLKSKYLGFTPTELKVSNLVKQGLSTKEIADLLNSSPETISGHRKSMRKKLKLTNKKSNLRTHLLSLDNG